MAPVNKLLFPQHYSSTALPDGKHHVFSSRDRGSIHFPSVSKEHSLFWLSLTLFWISAAHPELVDLKKH